MRFLIVGPHSSENTQDLVRSIQSSGHEATVCPLKELVLSADSKKGFEVSARETSIMKYDIIIFRAFNRNLDLGRLVARLLSNQGKTVIDEVVGRQGVSDKLSQAYTFIEHSIPHPLTLYVLTEAGLARMLERLPFPLIAKPVDGQQGKGVALLTNYDEMLSHFRKNKGGILFQKYIPITYDVRVFIVGNEILGSIKRFVLPKDFRSNASLGARVEAYNAPQATKEIALLASRALGYEVSGIDIIETSDGPLVLEANHTPQWQAFKKSTGINPATHIVEYALKKHASQNE